MPTGFNNWNILNEFIEIRAVDFTHPLLHSSWTTIVCTGDEGVVVLKSIHQILHVADSHPDINLWIKEHIPSKSTNPEMTGQLATR